MTTKQGLYNSIETMPIRVWHQILETNDLNLLYKPIESVQRIPSLFFRIYYNLSMKLGKFLRKTFRIKKDPVDLFKVWLGIQQEFFDEFGVDVEHQMRMNKIKKYIVTLAKYIETGDRKLLNKIQELELEMDQWGKDQTIKFYDLVSKVERVRKVPIDLDKITVIRWYHILRDTTEMQQTTSKDGY